MSYASEYLKKKLKEIQEDKENNSSSPSLVYQNKTLTAEDLAPLNNGYRDAVISGNIFKNDAKDQFLGNKPDDDDYILAPLPKGTVEHEEDGFLQKGVFDDGYQFGDVSKTILGTAGDITIGIAKGAVGLAEGVSDLLMYGGAGAASLLGNKGFSEALKEEATRSYTDVLFGAGEELVEKYSVLGKTSDAVVEGVGQVLGLTATGGLGAAGKIGAVGQSILTNGILGASVAGSSMSEAYLSGAEDGDAASYGTMSGAIAVGTELLFGGMGKAINALGFSRGLSSLDDIFAKKLSSKMSSTFFSNLTEMGVKASFEGLEEVLEGLGSAAAKKLTYMSDEELSELIKDENLLESFVVGTVTSGLTQIGAIPGMTDGGLIDTTKKGEDFITGLTKNEQSVIDKVYNDRIAEAEENGTKLTSKEKSNLYDKVVEDLKKGYISTDTIEEVLGGDDYKTYKDTVDNEKSILDEFKTLGEKTNPTLADQSRYAELKELVKGINENSKQAELKSTLGENVFNMLKSERKGGGSFLLESYNEKTRRTQAYEADLSKYDTKQAEVIKKAIDSGILNNTNRTHEFVDMVAKISADKGVLFDFANNAKLKESGFAVDGKFVNGYVTKDGITVNIESNKALNSIVGHEITHVLEGTELYNALQNTIIEYAKSKGDYQSRFDTLTELYKDIQDADVNAELTADLVGDYLFSDSDFINHLSTTNRNVFQKIFDEIKYLYKVATAGSKQARELEKVKKAFEDAYRESGKNTAKESGAKYSLSETKDGRFVAVVDSDILSNIDTSSWDKTKKNEAKKAASEALKKFNEGIVVDGITRKVNKISRNEYTRSNYTESLYLTNPDVFADKMRAADVVDDIVVAATNWNRDGALTHSRNDNFVDFDHGQTLIMSGDAKYSAEVVIGITSDGDAVFYDVVDMTPTTFEIKKAESSTAATTQDAIGDIHEDSANGIISQNSEKSIENTKFSLSDSEGNKLTQEQAEFFKDSKIRDKDGNLRVMHHGSSETFTVFDKNKAKSSGTYGNGFYFTDSTSHAGTYGNTIDVYLNITNPLQNGTNDITKEQIRKFVEALAENEDYGIENYGYDATIDSVTDSVWGKSDFGMILDLNISCVGNMVEAIELFNEVNGTDYNGIVAPTETVAFYPNQIKNIDNAKPTENPDIRYSLSDSEGKQLTKEQSEYFKDSKMRDDNGNLKVMYHGSQNAGFHVFEPAMSDDDTSLFFVDRNDVAASYSGTSETYEAQSVRTAEDVNNFIKSIGYEDYEVIERDGKFTLLYEGERVADSDTAPGIYEEFCWYEGVGEGDANYKVYLNLTNPLVVDAEGRNWNNITREYSQEIADRYHSLTADERAALTGLAEWGEYGIFKDEMLEARAAAEQGVGGVFDEAYTKNLARAYEKLGGANANLYDAFSIASDNFSEESIKQFAVKQMNTRDYAQKAKAEEYDGVIFKNIHDNGGYSNGSEGASTVAIAFNSNQVKSVANDKPTADKDIRYSLSETDKTYLEAVKRGDMETAQQMVYDAAKQAGYTDDMSYKMQHSAPNSKDDISLYDLKKTDLVPNDYWDHPEWYTYGAEERESFYKVKDALSKQERWDAEGKTNYKGEPAEAKIWVYRAVDKTVNSKEDHFRNGDWVTPSYDYAVNEGQMNPNGYRIIKKAVSIKELYWDGNSIAELGYDDGNNYAYRDTVNNRKLLDPVTYDNYGKVIPLSKRFKYRNSDTRYSLSETNEAPTKTYGNYNVYGKDIRLPGADDIAPVVENTITTEEADYLPEDYAPIVNSFTIEQELNEIQAEIDALVEEGTALYNKGDEAAANALIIKINELSDKARALTEQRNTLKAQEEADNKAYMDSITDADIPSDTERAYSEADTTPLDEKTLKKLTKGVRDALSITPKESKQIRAIIENYIKSGQSKSQLFQVLKDKYRDVYEYQRHDNIAQVQKHLKNTKITTSKTIKGDIADFGDFKKEHGLRDARNGTSVDIVYEELSGLFPDFFPSSITNPTDQYERIGEVMSIPAREWVKVAELTDNEIMQAVDFIHNEVVGYRNNEVRKVAEANARGTIDDIAPSRAKEITENVSDPNLRYQGVYRETQIKTVKERIAEKLSNVDKELTDNKRLRADSIVDFNREIARLQEEYNAKENKNTKVANNILRRIEGLQRMKNDVDADYEKRISDLETKKAKLSEEARTGTSATEQSIMRAELHLSKIDNIRAKYAENGLDFDETLKNAKDLSTFATVDNTPQRVMEKALGYKEGQILADLTVNKVAQNETEGIKWLNSYTDRKNGLIAQISKQYNIKPGSKESAAAQMYAEGFYVNKDNEIIQYSDNELAMDFPDAKVQANIKGIARDTRIRQIYDETLDMINESRSRNAYPEIQKLDNYFLHFRAMDDTFSRIGLPFNPNDIRAKDLPTDLNGVTADLKPGQPYFASAKHREGIKTSYDLLGGLERYLSSAKNQIYHIDDIQTLRALRNHIADTYGQAKGLEDLDSLSEAEAQERIKEVFDGHLSTFAKFLHEEANVIAGKTDLADRVLEGRFGRRAMTFMDTLNKQVGANMVGFNVSSSLTNFLALVQAFAKMNKAAFVKGFAQTASNKIGSIAGKTDGFAENSPVVIRRKGAERFYRTPFQKVGDAGYVLMSAVDDISTEIIARAKYNELTAKGMSADQAHVETDKWVSRLMGDRSLGQMPQLYNSKTFGLITKFQLEVRNQLDSQFYDTIQETKANNADIENALERNAKTAAKVALVFTELAIAQHLFGKAFEGIAGYNPAFDIISVIATALGFDDDEESEDTALDNIEQGFLELLGDLPYTSTLTGGRIPISSALPVTELIKGEDQYGNEKSRWETLGEIAPYYILPGGYGQLKKTAQGLGMFSDDHPIAGSYTDSGNLRFPVDETFLNKAQAAIFGQYASQNARDYFDNDIAPLKEKQIQEFIDVNELGMTIQEYWDYREGLSKYKTLAEKADYIYGLDLTDEQKNILINNIADREEDIDMSDYGNYSSFEEFDYANKYPEKYEFWKQNGISYEDYASGDDDTKAAYNWAYENPDKFTLSKAVASDVVTYRQYTKELYDLKADKDEDGKSISGSKKEKVIDYINNLDLDYGQKIILFRSMYNSQEDRDNYNMDIIEYLNERDDISYKQMETILKELGFTVDSQGNISWE